MHQQIDVTEPDLVGVDEINERERVGNIYPDQALRLRACLTTGGSVTRDELNHEMRQATIRSLVELAATTTKVRAGDAEARRLVRRFRRGERPLTSDRRVGDPRLPSPALAASTFAPACRPRERTGGRRRSSSARADPDPEPPPRLCVACGGDLEGRRRDARTCNAACRQAASRSARAVFDTWVAETLAIEEQALRLVRAKQISGEDALLLVVCPSQRVRRTLRTATE